MTIFALSMMAMAGMITVWDARMATMMCQTPNTLISGIGDIGAACTQVVGSSRSDGHPAKTELTIKLRAPATTRSAHSAVQNARPWLLLGYP